MWKMAKESCGVFSIFGNKEAAKLTYLGLYALQHRGQESAGIAVSDGTKISVHKGMGLVSEVFKEERLGRLVGHMSIGHVRYSTTGSSRIKNAQPFWVEYSRGVIAIVHNGNLVNGGSLRRKLEQTGAIFQSTMDSEIIVHLIAHSRKKKLEDALIERRLKVHIL
jgi:amidophosphoribosyltransferase